MGLVIRGNTVVVDHHSKGHLYTGGYGNPSKYAAEVVDVLSVYKRKKDTGAARRNHSGKRIGDNCPLIYALKGMGGLNVKMESIKRLLEYMPAILDDIVDQLPKNITDIVTIPSSYPLASILAKRMALRLSIPIHYNLLVKSTCFEATCRADRLLRFDRKSVSRDVEVDLRNTIKKLRYNATVPYSSKDTPVHIRHHFDPLRLPPGTFQFGNQAKVLLIDDLLASGETLVAANRFLKNLGLKSECSAVTWFGSL